MTHALQQYWTEYSLLNYTKSGISWKEHDVFKEQVISRNKAYFDVSDDIAELIISIIDDAHSNGWLK